MEQQDTHYQINIIENQQPLLGHLWLNLIVELLFENQLTPLQLEKGED